MAIRAIAGVLACHEHGDGWPRLAAMWAEADSKGMVYTLEHIACPMCSGRIILLVGTGLKGANN